MESRLAHRCPQESHEAPTPTFSTFQPMNLTQQSCRGLGWGSEPSTQVLKVQAAQPSPRMAHTMASVSAPGAACVPGNAHRVEEVPGEGDLSLQAEIRAWVQKTQAHWLLHRAAPVWFHGFITRREAERLLQPQPQGCYLVRFSESAVTFALSYRSRTCCRHFLLAQLRDGRHVVLGEDSAHEQLQDLLQHYTSCPLSPYGEMLTQPLPRQTPEPAGLFLRIDSDSGRKSHDPKPQHSLLIKQRQAQTPAHKEGAWELKEALQAPRPKPPIPAKPQLPPELYASPASQPHRALPTIPIYQEPDEPIAFYAMGWGGSRNAPSNIYTEVEGPSPGHSILQKCHSRLVPGGQVKGSTGKGKPLTNVLTLGRERGEWRGVYPKQSQGEGHRSETIWKVQNGVGTLMQLQTQRLPLTLSWAIHMSSPLSSPYFRENRGGRFPPACIFSVRPSSDKGC